VAEGHAPAGYVGQAVRRREDPRLVRGQGLYVADVRLPGLVHAAVLRSPYAHARLRGVDVRRAAEQPGVLAALSYADLGDGTPKLPNLVPHKLLHAAMPYPLARDKVHYAGEPVAVVVAADLSAS
jgi:carbon-monoxide dehydrogenase large subunit